MLIRTLILLALSVFINACASFRSVSSSRLQELQLPGRWTSGYSWIEIYCSGAINYKMHTLDLMMKPAGGSCDGCNITSLEDNKITVGPGFAHKTFQVISWPAMKSSQWQMTTSEYTWTRDKIYTCD